jgi:hypothetical protein
MVQRLTAAVMTPNVRRKFPGTRTNRVKANFAAASLGAVNLRFPLRIIQLFACGGVMAFCFEAAVD